MGGFKKRIEEGMVGKSREEGEIKIDVVELWVGYSIEKNRCI
jgi:hypothetical protein